MSTEPSGGEIQSRVKRVLQAAREIVGDHFPPFKLENRLLNLGLGQFVDEAAVQKQGFPFRFSSPIDEVILVLAHFLDRFRKENGSLKIYAISRISRGEDRTLSFWQDAKVKLYLEIQNMILLLGEGNKERSDEGDANKRDNQNQSGSSDASKEEPERTSEISRIFTFRELSDLAFLTQSAINVLGEQRAIGIRVGFVSLNSYEKQANKQSAHLYDGLIVDYSPGPPRPGQSRSEEYNFYQLYNLADESKRLDLPYQETCMSKWFLDENQARNWTSENGFPFLLDIHRKWEELSPDKKELSPDNADSICELEKRGEFFNDATVMMYKAFHRSKVEDNYKEPNDFIAERINKTVITRDMIRLHRAISAFTNAKNITAVDATSVKRSLQIHESRPTYRDWLRRSLNRVLRSSENSLRRIYILRDHDEDKESEYQTFLRLMQYYLDYFHYEISEMAEILHKCDPGDYQKDRTVFYQQEWFKKKWKKYPEKIEIYVTTTTTLEKFTNVALKDGLEKGEYPATFRRILTDSKGSKSNSEYLRMLDYLFTDDMIYNFINPLADTNELEFPAFLYRDFLVNEKEKYDQQLDAEEEMLFNFMPDSLKPLEDLQLSFRTTQLATSIVTYAEKHEKSLRDERKSDSFKNLETDLAQGNIRMERRDLLDTRASFEAKLYGEFRRHFEYLYEVLKFQSVKVEFWEDIHQLLIKKINPFSIGQKEGNLSTLQEKIRAQIEENLKDKDLLPKLAPPNVTPTDATESRSELEEIFDEE